MANSCKPLYLIQSTAPIRICDNGGWTDTWFAGHGKVFNIAVTPRAQVQLAVWSSRERVLNAENYGDRYVIDPTRHWGAHPLLEAAIEFMQVPADIGFEASIFSEMPGGASTGTSAAVTVALIGALDRLTGRGWTPHQIAEAAHRVETELLQQQCGIQDQLCAAYGGINYIEMDAYPHATVTPVQVTEDVRWELERRLVLVVLGKAHRSSDIHTLVIRELEKAGPDCRALDDLRVTAQASRDALQAGDFAALGAAMRANSEAQARLHPALVGTDAARVIAVAQAHGALGWKVNGAGGEGGSVTLLCGANGSARRAMVREIEQENALYKNIPIALSRAGLTVWTTRP